MSSRKSKLRKIIRAQERRHKKVKTLVEKNRKPGETDEQMLERQKNDLSGWLDMMSEREVEEALLGEVDRQKVIEDLQSIEIGEGEVVVTEMEEEK